jgi:hypothetical protein
MTRNIPTDVKDALNNKMLFNSSTVPSYAWSITGLHGTTAQLLFTPS